MKKIQDPFSCIVGLASAGSLEIRFHQFKFPIFENQSDLIALINQLQPNEIVIGQTLNSDQQINEIIEQSDDDTTPIHILPHLPYDFIGHQITHFHGLPIISLNMPPLKIWGALFKRCFDFTFALLGLIIVAPLIAALAIMVKLTSCGPIFYSQERMGLDGLPFKMWKIRSMHLEAEKETGAVWCRENDPRRTKIGQFLRSTSLDELPQLWNVLWGEMSLVGPRPERPVFVNKFRKEIPAYMLRHRMKAGITGWAQVNGWRGNTSLEKRIEFDIFYIRHWSFWMDLKIILLTFWKGLINKNAY